MREWIVLIGIALVGCSSGSSGFAASDLSEAEVALGGLGVVDAVVSTANRLDTPAGVAGAVASVEIEDQGGVIHTCTGVLVERRTVVTSLGCANLQRYGGIYGKGDVQIVFSQDPLQAFALAHNPIYRVAEDLVLFRLDEPVPVGLVKNLPPIFSGDVGQALMEGNLDGASAVLVGLGSSCDGCTDSRVRRVGQANTEVAIEAISGRLLLELDPDVGADLYGLGDAGAPLFLWDDWSQRYVLVGIPADRFPVDDSVHSWEILGKNETLNIDRWSTISRLWLKPDGAVAVGPYPDGPAEEGWEPLLGWDIDRDGVLDQADNCPASECVERGIEMWECEDPFQKDEDGDGVGDKCLLLSNAVPEYCKEVSVPPEAPDGGFTTDWLAFNWRAARWNSNVDAEERVEVAAKPDICDPVPQLRFMERPALMPLAAYPSELAKTQYDLSFLAQPILGGGSFDPVLAEARVDFGFCACDKGQGRCADDNVCNPIDLQHGREWKKYLTVSGPPYQTFHEYPGEAIWPAPSEYTWNWRKDARNGRIDVKWTGEDEVAAAGFFGTTVRGDAWQSQRDSAWEGGLRSVVGYGELKGELAKEIVQTPEFVIFDRLIFCIHFEHPIVPCPCEHKDPGRFLDRFAFPTLVPYGLKLGGYPFHEVSQVPVITVFTEEGDVLGIRDSWAHFDISPLASQDFLNLLQHGRAMAFASGVEPQSVPAAFGFPGGAIGIEEGQVGEIFRVTHGGQLDATSLGLHATVGIDTRILYSSIEDAFYMVGGGGADLGVIRRLNLATGVETRIQPTAYQPTETILGAGYDPGTSTMYVLDAATTEGVAKLVAHDLISGKSNQLFSLPFTDLYDYTSLDVADDGQLVMTVGTTTSFTSWRIDKDGGSFLGRIDGQGEMLRLPTMGWNFLSFPFFDNDGLLHTQRQASWDFMEGPGCEGL